jgi:DNA polymerase III epsilon subunit-like protein
MNHLVIDTETGGLETGQPIMQLAYNLYQDGLLTASHSVYLTPQNQNITPKAIEVNGLTEDVLNKLIAEQGFESNIESEISTMLELAKEHNAIILGYRVDFDIRMIAFFASDKDKKTLEEIEKTDVKALANTYLGGDTSISLVNAYKELFDKDFNAHNAIDDVCATWNIFCKLHCHVKKMVKRRVMKAMLE